MTSTLPCILITLLYLMLFWFLLHVIKNKNDVIFESFKRLNTMMIALVRHKKTIKDQENEIEDHRNEIELLRRKLFVVERELREKLKSEG